MNRFCKIFLPLLTVGRPIFTQKIYFQALVFILKNSPSYQKNAQNYFVLPALVFVFFGKYCAEAREVGRFLFPTV